MSEKRSLTDRLWDNVPKVGWPKLGKTAEIPVYVIHNSPDPEDYFFIFDFEEFVNKSKEGMFVRPVLKVWAGRSDFARGRFARQFRESFTEEFEAARHALDEQDRRVAQGWFTFNLGLDVFEQLVAKFVANIVLMVALSAGKLVLSAIPFPKWSRGKSKKDKLEASIAETQVKVDAALKSMEITLHKELWTDAYRGTTPGPMTGMDKDAWPLPASVRQHLRG